MSLSAFSRRTAHRRGTGVSLLIFAGVAWGTGGLLGSLLGRETGLPPLAVAAYRLGLGGLLILAAVAGRPLLAGTEHRRSALYRIGLVAVLAATFQACYFTAVSLTTVGLATLVTIGTAPVVVVAVETLRGRARRGSLPVVALALLGLGLLVGMPAAGANPLAGAAAAVVSGSGFAVMTLVGARPVPGLDPMVATGASFVVGGLLLAVPAAMLGRMTFPMTFSGVGLLALFAVLPTALAYTAYFRGLGAGASPGTGAVLALLEPLTAAALAAIVLGERLTPAGVAGAGLLTVAVLLAAGGGRAGAQPRCLTADSAAGAPAAPREVARRISRAGAARSAAGVDRRREAIGGGGSGGPKRGRQS